jgi:hypothetical protein
MRPTASPGRRAYRIHRRAREIRDGAAPASSPAAAPSRISLIAFPMYRSPVSPGRPRSISYRSGAVETGRPLTRTSAISVTISRRPW